MYHKVRQIGGHYEATFYDDTGDDYALVVGSFPAGKIDPVSDIRKAARQARRQAARFVISELRGEEEWQNARFYTISLTVRGIPVCTMVGECRG